MPIASSLLNKPRLVEKLRKFYDYVQKNNGEVGTKTRGIDLNFNNACNLRCKYCFTNSPKGDHVKEYLDIKAIKKLADEADELGYFEFDLQGGELLLHCCPQLDLSGTEVKGRLLKGKYIWGNSQIRCSPLFLVCNFN